MLDDDAAHASTVDTAGPVASACRTGETTHVWPSERTVLRCGFGLLAVVEQAVHARAGAAHVGAERARIAQSLGQRRRREIVRRQPGEIVGVRNGAERRQQGIATLCEAVGAVPVVEGAVDVACRGLDRLRRNDEQHPVVGRQRDGAENRAVAAAELWPAARGRTARLPRSSLRGRPAVSGREAPVGVRSRAAAQRPRPSCRRRARRQRGSPSRSRPPSAARRLRAPRGRAETPVTIVSSANPETDSRSPAASVTVSASETRSSTVTTSCLPSSRSGPTTSERLIFACAASRLTAPTVPARERRAARAPRRARPGRDRAR